MSRDDVVRLVGLDNVHVLLDPEAGALDGQVAGHEIVHDHVPGHVPPLVEKLAQFRLLRLRERML